jgi:hypothetical protein
MPHMFHGAISFNQDLSVWDVSMVVQKKSMFAKRSMLKDDFLPSTWRNDHDVAELMQNS